MTWKEYLESKGISMDDEMKEAVKVEDNTEKESDTEGNDISDKFEKLAGELKEMTNQVVALQKANFDLAMEGRGEAPRPVELDIIEVMEGVKLDGSTANI